MEAPKPKTIDDLLASPGQRLELINGEIVRRPTARAPDGFVQGNTVAKLDAFRRTASPSGWGTLSEVSSEIGFEEDLMRRLIEGTLDVGLMYTPSHAPGLVVEHLFDQTLVLVSSGPKTRWPDDDYICVDWGPGFYAKHRESDPDLPHAPQVVNVGWLAIQIILAGGGSCFLPIRMAQPLIAAGRLFQCAAAPELTHPAYVVFPREIEDENLRDALHTLRVPSREASTG